MKKLVLIILFSSITVFTQPEEKMLNVAIFIYNNVEILDFAGPGEVFAASVKDGKHLFNVYTVAAEPDPVLSQGFVKITPEYTLENCPTPDIVVLPGGDQRKSAENSEVINWIKKTAENADVMMSVCTGAKLLSKAGLLDNKEATTWYGAIESLQEMTPSAKVHKETRFVDNGQIITTAGVSAGIDGALHVVSRLFGLEQAEAVAKYMEYDKWVPDDGMVVSK